MPFTVFRKKKLKIKLSMRNLCDSNYILHVYNHQITQNLTLILYFQYSISNDTYMQSTSNSFPCKIVLKFEK